MARVGSGVGAFVSRAQTDGVVAALRDLDLGEFADRPAQEVLPMLVDRLAAPTSTMDDQLARRALDRLWREMLADAKDAQSVQDLLRGVVQRIEVGVILVRFYGHYVFEKFRQVFYERFVARVGRQTAQRRMAEVQRAILETVRARAGSHGAERVDWRGAAGQRMADEILDSTFRAFTVTT